MNPTSSWDPKAVLLEPLVAAVPRLLKRQDRKTGRFGTKPWICTDQNILLALAVAWATRDRKNSWYHDRSLLEAIMIGGDALVDDQDENGMWTFRKKDRSTWGQIAMPWTYSRWVRAFDLIRNAMPAGRRKKWEQGLKLGYETISANNLKHIHNIPCHHAMGLYCAGKVFKRSDWKKQAAAFMRDVVARQYKAGYWSEHEGPVVLYNSVYSEALGAYYDMSGDKAVLPALRRAVAFHANLTYPDGSTVAAVDERNPYHRGHVSLGNAGLSVTPEGRAYIQSQWERIRACGGRVSPDIAAQLVLHGQTGPTSNGLANKKHWTAGTGRMQVLRAAPWFIVGSAYVAEVPQNRWIQDRQNFLGIFHEKTGLILGGGNTKLQPYWSNFTVGDRSKLFHKHGDVAPDFIPPESLVHVPHAAALKRIAGRPHGRLDLTLLYTGATGNIKARPVDAEQLRIVCTIRPDRMPSVHGHLTLIPHIGQPIRTAAGQTRKLNTKPFEWTASECGGWIEHAGWRLTLPAGTRVLWPKKPHNPYKKRGRSNISSARIVVEMKFSRSRRKFEFVLSVSE